MKWPRRNKIELSPDVIARVTKRRGGKPGVRPVDPAKTALIVIDMAERLGQGGDARYTPLARPSSNINLLAGRCATPAARWWIRNRGDDAPRTWSAYMEFLSPEFLGDMLGALTEGEEGAMLWHAPDVQPGDQHVIKRRFSALIQGSSDLLERLQAAGIDTVIIAGTATNICCESTARDAFMLNYRTLVVSDANATVSDEAHNASLNALFMRFADVFTTAEVVDLLAQPTRNARQRARP
jgi:ureidoacrylate peracid hydrolase